MVTLHTTLCGMCKVLYVFNTTILSMDLFSLVKFEWKKHFVHSDGHYITITTCTYLVFAGLCICWPFISPLWLLLSYALIVLCTVLAIGGTSEWLMCDLCSICNCFISHCAVCGIVLLLMLFMVSKSLLSFVTSNIAFWDLCTSSLLAQHNIVHWWFHWSFWLWLVPLLFWSSYHHHLCCLWTVLLIFYLLL